MPYGYMTLQEVARFLGTDTRRTEKMAQRGQIPCQKVGGNLRFNRAEITEWLQQHMPTLGHEKLAEMDAGIAAHRQTSPDQLMITPHLHHDGICIDFPARTKNSVLKELVILAEKTEKIYDPDALLETLKKREELCSTALEGGIAIPHPRRPQPYIIDHSILVVARTSQGIGYGAPDGRLTDLFFMTCSTDDHHHLHILARLCRMLHDEDFVNALRHATDNDQILTLMLQREQDVIK